MAGFLESIIRRVQYGKPVVIVSGLPRSGTSMAMKMLEAGGLSLVTDGIREADVDNPKGYFEYEKVKDLDKGGDNSWAGDLKGQTVKIISSLLEYLPDDVNYRIVFMRRDLGEITASQNKMLDHRGEENPSEDERMKQIYEMHLRKMKIFMRNRAGMECLEVHFKEVMERPREHAVAINKFLGNSLDVDAMTAVVDKQLYRNRS